MAESLFDPATMQKIVEIVNRIYQNIDRIGGQVDGLVSRAGRGADATAAKIENVRLKATGLRQEIEGTGTALVELGEKATSKGLHQVDAFIRAAERELDSVARTADESLVGRLVFGQQGINSISGRVGGVMGSIQNVVAGARSQIFAGMPAAGLLGAALLGATTEAEFSAKANRAAFAFSDVVDSSAEDVAKLRAVMVDLDQNRGGFMSSDELMQSQAVFAKGGISLAASGELYKSTFLGIEERVDKFAATMDKTFDLANGTAAGAMTNWMKSTGGGMRDAARWFEDVATAARRTGTSVSGMLSTMTAVAGSLRYQAVEARGLVAVYAQLQGVNNRLGLGGAAGAQAALGTVQNIGQVAGNLSQGSAAYYGNRIAGTRGLEGYYLMSQGFRTPNSPGGRDTGFEVLSAQMRDVTSAIKLQGDQDYEGLGRRQVMLESLGYSRQDAAVLAELSKVAASMGTFDAAALTDAQKKAMMEVETRRMATEEPVNLILKQLNSLVAQFGTVLVRTGLATVAGINVLIEGISRRDWSGATEVLAPHIQGIGAAGKELGVGLEAFGAKSGVAFGNLSGLKYSLPAPNTSDNITQDLINSTQDYAERMRLLKEMQKQQAAQGDQILEVIKGGGKMVFRLVFDGWKDSNAVEAQSAGGG